MKKSIIIAFLILLGLFARFFPHSPNFAPIGAISLFSGIYLSRKLAITVPIISMIISDLFIGFYSWKIMLAVYLGFIIMVFLGMLVKKRKNVTTILYGTLAGSLAFFIITNAAVWLFSDMYAHTVSGLLQCYYMALPFFKNSLMSDLTYTATLTFMMEFWLAKFTPFSPLLLAKTNPICLLLKSSSAIAEKKEKYTSYNKV